jgi:ABC-2 type transport system permease protein
MRAALWAETVKLTGSLVGRVATIALVVGIAALTGSILLAAASGNPQLVAKLGPGATADWNGFLLSAAQITGAGGMGGFGIVVAWMFGREFGDGTITGLFALPVRRATIAGAKLLVYAGWAVAVSVLLAAVLLVEGLIAGLGPLTEADAMTLLRQLALSIMTAAIAVPVAWAATLGRGVLAGVSVAIGLVVVAQFSVLAGAGGWMPLAAPALWAISSGVGVTAGQLSLLIPFVALAAAAVLVTWQRLQLDR